MNIERTTYLYRQYQAKALTESEQQEWDVLLASPDLDEALKGITSQDWDALSEDAFLEMKSGRSAEILSGIMDRPQERESSRRLWPRVAVAAAVATVIFGAGLFYFTNQKPKTEQAIAVVQDVAPGKVGATLTLASGKKIVLSDAVSGELAKEAGVVITKSKDGKLVYEVLEGSGDANKINTLSTARGETYELRLPDGSLVALNAASSLSYPANFTALKERRVKLTGEGYFEVAKDKLHPFVVSSASQQVEVLGTHFNVNAYADEASSRTTLLEGSVRVTAGDERMKIVPGEQAAVSGSGIKVAEVDVDDAVAWKNGDIQFDRKSIPEVMRQISRWYGVEVVYEGEVPSVDWSGSVSRNRPVSQVLRMMEKGKQVKFRIEGKTIFVSK